MTFAGQGMRILVQVLSVAVLARLLDPRDYGLLAMVVVVVGVGEVVRDFGLSSAAVQARDLTRQQRDNLFWINTGIGMALAVLVAMSAEGIAELYDRPELVGIARALSVTFVLNGLATQYRADLVRRLCFGRVAFAQVSAPAVALAVAVVIAVSGGGYWALVAQNITQAGALLLALVLGGRWLPGLPRRGAHMRDLLQFGGRLLTTQLIGYVSNNVDNLIIGLRFGAGPLGVYSRGFQLLMTPLSQLRSPTTTVALPVLSRLQDDPVRYDEVVRRGQIGLGYTLVAGLALVVAAAEPITAVFLGPRWDTVAPILRLLALAGIFQTLAYVGYWVYLSRNLTAELLRYSLVTAAIKITCIAVGSLWGIIGVAAGYALAPALAWPLSLWWLSRKTRLPRRALIIGALRILALAAAAAGVTAGVDTALVGQADILRLVVAATVALAVYGAAAALVPSVRRDAAGVIEVARMARKVRAQVTA